MARAKRFDRDRAEARRRYRAAVDAGEAPESEEAAEGEAVTAPAAGASSAPSPRRATARPAGGRPSAQPARPRMGIIQAARAAYRVVNLREDLRALPRILAHRSLWIPVLLSLVSTVLVVVTGPNNPVTTFAFQVFSLPPAMASVFIAGFFAPTAAWLAGGIVGTAASVFYGVFLYLASQGIVPDFAASATQQVSESILTAFVIGPMYGIVLGAAAAWYKRWLSLSSPARTPRRGTPANRNQRGGGGRSSRGR